ncbi:PREDICTED: RING-H2 finger protein ATL70-like [Ipomoea nil]|uniref:RING-H2 finger protein ATL70-like n=1 Tax=Ipomoea nil TaxID=35883 RepID=UPI000901C360|nr:PREDICTED: RING-H2 finger protein ATL70-like [Ipomoea nil]
MDHLPNTATINNNTSYSRGYLSTAGTDISSFGSAIGVSIGILFFITTITLASYFCTRNQTSSSSSSSNQRPQPRDPQNSSATETGLDEETLLSYPKLVFSQAAKVSRKDSTAATCCSICLADYKSSDTLRLLPECGHLFHLKCVDPWLRLHPTCPVCRTSPLPTPQSTPLADAVPLASLRVR